MPKGVKIGLVILVPLLLVALGAAYGLAKLGIIPVQKIAGNKKPLLKLFRTIGLKVEPEKPKVAAAHPVVDPLASERKAILDQRFALEKERADWQAQEEAKQKAALNAKRAELSALPDPKELTRLAAVYEQMPTDTMTKIFAKLPDDQVIALLRRMEEKKVADVLASVTPERAARLTLNLSHVPTPLPDRLAANP